MALERQTIAVPFAQGIDTKTDPKQVAVGKLTVLENSIFTSLRRIKKRNGFSPISTAVGGNGLTAGTAVASFGTRGLVALDGTNLYSYSTRSQKFTSAGSCPAVSLSRQIIDGARPSKSSPNLAYHAASGLACMLTVTLDAGLTAGLQYAVIDFATGATVTLGQVLPSAATNPITATVDAVGDQFVIVTTEIVGAAAQLNYRTIAIAAGVPGTLSAATTIESGATTSPPVHDTVVSGGDLFIAHALAGSSPTSVVLHKLTSALALSGPLTLGTDTLAGRALSAVGAFLDSSGNIVVGYKFATLSTVFLAAASPALGLLAPGAATPIVFGGASEHLTITGYSTTGTGVAARPVILCVSAIDAAAPPTRARTYLCAVSTSWSFLGYAEVDNWVLASRPFTLGTQPYVAATFVSSVQQAHFIVPLPPDTTSALAFFGPVAPLARLYEGAAGLSDPLRKPGLGQPVTLSGTATVPLLRAVQGSRLSGLTNNVADLVSISLGGAQTTLELGGALHISQSGFLRQFDGQSVVEQGFHTYPEIESVAGVAGGTNAYPAGNYQFVAVFEWIDGQGQRQRSAPSVPVQVASGGWATFRVIVKAPVFTARSTLELVIYRTTANGTVFYRETGLDTGHGPLYVSLPYTGPTATISFDDVYNGSVTDPITSNEVLYTTGGVLENLPAPACSVLGVYKNRLLAVPELAPLSIWYSQQVIPGSPVEFNDSLVQNIDSTGGARITGLAWLDDKLLMFKEAVVFYMGGDGPDARGQLNNFTTPTVINTNSGCVNSRSVATGANGVVYQSAKGFFILDRSLTDSYIGKDVEAYNAETVSSVEVVKNANQMRWTLLNGTMLVYDFLVGQWGTFPGIAAVGATTYNNNHTYIDAAGVVYSETPGAFTDSGALVPMKVSTGWLSFAGLSGYQRVYRMMILGDYRSAHKLRVQVAADYDDTVLQDFIISPTAIVSSGRPAYEFKVKLLKQKCQAIKITLTEIAEGTPAEGLSLSGLTFEVGVIPNTARVASVQSVG